MSDDAPQPERLQQLQRLSDLSDSDLQKVVKAGRQVHLPADWSLMSEKTPSDKAYLIVDGQVSVRRGGEEVATLGPGDLIGEMSIVERKLRNASVVSTTELEVVHFTREAIEQLTKEVPAFGEAVRATDEDRRDS